MVDRMFHSAIESQALDAEPLSETSPLAEPAPGSQTPLYGFLAAQARRHPEQIVFRDQRARAGWSERPSREWSAAAALDAVMKLAAYIAGLGLAPGATIGIHLAGDTEFVLTLLAVERAGLTPCLLPLAAERETIAGVIEAAGIQAIVTQASLGDDRPADLICAIAAGYFRLRFLMAFGPDVPDGVVDLDGVLAELEGSGLRRVEEVGAFSGGIVTLSRGPIGDRLLFRPYTSLVAATASILVPARIKPGHRVLTLLAPDDLRGLAIGPVAALLSNATLEHHAMFDAASLLSAIEEPRPTHLVAPGWMEATLASLDLPGSVESIILIHDAPARFRASTALRGLVVDVLAFDEIALIAGARTATGLLSLSLEEPTGGKALAHLLEIRVDDDGTVSFRGPAALLTEFPRPVPDLSSAAGWRSSGFKAELFAGRVIGVS